MFVVRDLNARKGGESNFVSSSNLGPFIDLPDFNRYFKSLDTFNLYILNNFSPTS